MTEIARANPRPSSALPQANDSGDDRAQPVMDLWETLRTLRRRWPILAVVGLITSLGIAGVLRAVPPTYEARSTLLLLVPATVPVRPDGTVQPATNPYLGFGGALIVTANVMSQAMNQDRVAAALKQRGAEASFTILTDPTGQSPTLTVVANDPDRRQALLTVQKVLAAIRDDLARRQEAAGAPAASRIVADDVTTPESPKALHGNQIRALLGVGGVGAALAMLLVFAAEALARRLPVRRPNATSRWTDDDDQLTGTRSRVAL